MRTIQPKDWVKVPVNFKAAYQNAEYWTKDLLGDIATTHAEKTPHALAVTDGNHRWDYATLEAEATALAAGWLKAGIGRGSTAIVQLPNCAQFVAVLLSLWKIGAVPVMALPAHRMSELTGFAEQARASAYISTARTADFDQLAAAADLRAEHPDLLHIVVDTNTQSTSPSRNEPRAEQQLTYPQLKHLGADAPTPPFPSVDPDDVALLQLSGGSTGTPKLIPRTHADYLYSVRESARICGITASSVYLCVLPCAHNFALSSAGILGQLYAGGATVMAPDPSPHTCFPLIKQESVSITGVVPPIALLWLAAARKSREMLGSLQVFQVGGAKLSYEVARRIEPELGCRLQQVFGMAEGLVNYTRLDDPLDVIVSTQGRPMSNADEVRVVDDTDTDVPDGVAGHLLTRGPYTIRGYFRASEHNRVAFTPDGFYRTGDIVVRTPDGYLTVVGRSKDQVNRGGEKIASEELENHLLAHPSIFEAAVVGEPDPVLGERVVAHIVVRDDDQSLVWSGLTPVQVTNDVRAFLRTRQLAAYKLPDRVLVVPELPRTAVGKTSVASLRSIAAQAPAGRGFGV